MRAAGGQAQHHVTGLYGRAVDDFAFFHDADRKPGQIVFPRRIHPRHLGGLPANQRAAGLFATGSDAFDHIGGGSDIKFAAGKVIEEEQRFGALRQNVIDAHRDQIDADRVVTVELEGEFELGAHAIGTGNQYRLFVFGGQTAECTEAADPGHHFGPHGSLGKGLDVFDECVAGVDIDAGVTISECFGGCAQGVLSEEVQGRKGGSGLIYVPYTFPRAKRSAITLWPDEFYPK